MRCRPSYSPRSPWRIRGWLAAAAGIAAVAAGAASAAGPGGPERIASMNPCTDQLVWMLADRHRIVSLSHLAADREASVIADEVDVPHFNHGEAEEILPLDPDLVLNGPFSHKASAQLLARLGYRVVEIDTANSIDDIRRHVRQVGRILGAEARAEDLIAGMDARIAALSPPADGPRPTAINYQPNGFSAGEGTLIADILVRAGFDLPGGIGGYRHLPLERLIADPPDVLIVDTSYGAAPTLSVTLLHHPVLARMGGVSHRIDIPNRLWLCGTPTVVGAFERLADVRRAWLADDRGRP